MRREIYIDDFPGEDRPRRRKDQYGRGGGIHHNRPDRGRGNHIFGGRRDGVGPHFEEGCNTERRVEAPQRIYNHKYYTTDETSKTKMFSSKKELTEYVNEVGETGQRVDIFKIEDELYKVVTYGKIEGKE